MKNIFRLIVLICLTITGKGTFAQKLLMPQINIPTPNASSLGAYGEVPVSLFTGTPNINIPVYELKEDHFILPINLSYYYSGSRPNIMPGWIGSGWSVMAGGAITRVVKTIADETSNTTYSVNANYGFYFNANYLQDNNWESTSFLQSYFGTNFVFAPIAHHETDPDEFNFNFLGISGSFYRDENNNWQVKSDHDLKVTFNGNFISPFICKPTSVSNFQAGAGINKPFESFTITDGDGIQYVFGENEAIEYSENWVDTPVNTSLTATSWYLSSIILPNAKIIKFTYDRGPFIPQLDRYYSYEQKNHQGAGGLSLDVSCGQDPFNATLNAQWRYSGKLESPLYLKSIESPSCLITFDATASNGKSYTSDQYDFVASMIKPIGNTQTIGDYLGQYNAIFSLMTYTNNNYQDLKIPYYTAHASEFKQSIQPQNGETVMTYYKRRFVWMKLSDIMVRSKADNATIKKFHLNYDESTRLKLTDFQNLDKNGVLINKYHFDYNTAIQLPDFLTDQTDHWGFYNGLHQSSTYNNYTDQKNANSNSLAEILLKITYPTGGYSQFYPEVHQYGALIDVSNPSTAPLSTSGYAGGVRIKMMETGDGLGHTQTTNYYYVKNYTYGANPNNLISSGELSGIPKYTYSNLHGIADDGANYVYDVFNSLPVIPASQNTAGAYIGYSSVVEQRSDGTYTLYNYTNFSSGSAYRDADASAVINADQYPFLPKNDNSELRGKLKSTQVYSNTGIVSEKINDNFQAVPNNSKYIRSITPILQYICGTHWVSIASANRRYLYSYLPTRETERLYSNGVYIEKVTNTTYDSQYKKVISSSTSTSDNNTITYNFKYPFNYLTTPVYQQMVNDYHIVNPVISQAILKNATPVQTTQLNYKKWVLGNFFPENAQVSNGNNPLEKRHEFIEYDGSGNLNSESKGVGPIASYLWGYQNQYLIAKCVNASLSQIAYQNCEEQISDVYEDDNEANIRFSNLNNSLFSNDCRTGHKSYNLIDGNYMETVRQLPAGTYVVSYWSKGFGQIAFDGNVELVSYRDLPADNRGWIYHEAIVKSPSLDYFELYPDQGGNPLLVDDLRIYPVGALMTTYTYDPLVGITSSTDEKNQTTYYEYDDFQRLMNVKDKDGNVTKRTDYHYQGQ